MKINVGMGRVELLVFVATATIQVALIRIQLACLIMLSFVTVPVPGCPDLASLDKRYLMI